MPNFSRFGFANASSYSKFVKLLQDISMTSQFHRNFFVKILLFKFDKLFDLKVVTAFYESHFRHCVILEWSLTNVEIQMWHEKYFSAIVLKMGWQPLETCQILSAEDMSKKSNVWKMIKFIAPYSFHFKCQHPHCSRSSRFPGWQACLLKLLTGQSFLLLSNK